MKFLNELRRRNPVLYYFGWIYFAGGITCIILSQTTETIVLGINAFIKPAKFFLSIWIFCWTMGWYLEYLDNKRRVRNYTWMVVIVMIIEQFIITWQAANGRLSHFNTTSPFYQSLFYVMGAAITLLTIWTGIVGIWFCKQKQFKVPMPYIWGIRLGIFVFVIFALEGGYMASQLSHTVGAAMGGPGLPVVNWSTEYGDLRVSHFIGIHSLQVFPLFGYFIGKTNRSVQIFSAAYFLLTILLLVQALQKSPLL
jgi:hypothetical protein